MDSHNTKLSARIGIRRDESRPLTAMGNAELKLESTQAKRAPLSGRGTGEFDVRQFLLDQKADQPLHKSSLFRGPASTSNSTGRPGSPKSPPTLRETKSRKKLLPRMDITQSTGSLPRPSTTHSDALHTRRTKYNEANNPEEDDCISHFYTLERMGESCYHAVQNRNKTWLFLPGAEERSKGGASNGNSALTAIERPSRRADLLDLQRCYDAALQFVNKKHDRDVECSDRLAMVDRDFVAMQARVSDKYASRVAGEGDADEVVADQKVLARLFFEQKWADVVLGELEAMLTVSFLEQGIVLRKTRIQYAQAFFHLEKLYAGQWNRLNGALDDLERLRADSRRTDEIHDQRVREMKEKYEGEIKRLSAVFDVTKSDMERKVAESKDQMTKMGDTMKTLNAIFRQMREDTDKVKAVELRENYIKLEQKHEAVCEEVARLRPLVDQNAQLSTQLEDLMREREQFKDDMAQLDVLLNTKDETIATLMERQSDLLAAQELREAKEEEMRLRAAEEKEDEEYEDNEPVGDATMAITDDTDGSGSASTPSSRKRSRRSGSSVVCVRCKQDLRSMSAKGGVTESSSRTLNVSGADDTDEYPGRDPPAATEHHMQSKRKRIQCLYFRILLPNLRGRRPQREPAWTFSCMRAILFSKQIDDAMTRRNGGTFPSRIRMPEFVYSWFAPWRSIKDGKLEAEFGVEAAVKPIEVDIVADDGDDPHDDPSVRSFLSSEQRQMQADEERWCLYYGVKALVQQGYLEAKLFLSLMDEKFGEDELVFMLYCYQLLDVLVGGKLNWGPLRDKVAYCSFAREFENLYGSPSSPSSRPPAVVPKTIWISPYHASLATSIVLARATESEREALDQKMMAYVVTNVPDDERPLVFLTPEQMGIKGDMFGRKKPHRRHTDDDEEESDPPQFIDAHLWVELMMLEYKEEQAHRRAAIRLMFQTATASVTNGEIGSMAIGATNGATMDMEQFRVMVRTLNDETPAFVVATLFRNAYTKGNGVVTFDAFMEAAETSQFFSTCMRLESPASCLARLASSFSKVVSSSTSPMLTAVATSSRAAFLVEKLFTILRHELATMVAALPLWTRSVTDELVYDISSTLMGSDDGNGGGSVAFTDGMRLLASFHRLIEYLQLVKLVRREVTGEAVSSKHIFSIEKALNALVDSVRLRDKSSVELLIDTVKQKLCVKRVQLAFRQHLQREFGAPLAMRALLHRDYGRSLYAPTVTPTSSSAPMPSYRTRNAVRTLEWLLSVISKIFRLSLQSDRVPTLLLELSSVSSAIVSSTSQHLLDSPGSASAGSNGIGPAPRSVLLELVYDFFISRFGTRWEAEKLIHDLFTTCRGAIRGEIPGSESERGHPLAWLFGYVCCMDALPPWSRAAESSSDDGGKMLDDRILGQNEAMAFVQAIVRCGMHRFALLDPQFATRPVDESSDEETHIRRQPNERWSWPADWIDVLTAEKLLVVAFEQLGIDQTQRIRSRLRAEAASVDSNDDALDANTFLVLALHEWRRYMTLRMNEVRAICRTLESDEVTHFERVLPLETIATVLQKAGVMFSGDELSMVFRRLLTTEPPLAAGGTGPTRPSRPSSSASASTPLAVTKERLSERISAASFPLLAREPLNRLAEVEDAASEAFKIAPNARLGLDLLLRSWREYEDSARELMEKLRHVGKSNDIQAEAFSRSGVGASPAPQQRQVLYLSSSTSGNVSSQDVAQLEAAHSLFLERLAVATNIVANADNETAEVANSNNTNNAPPRPRLGSSLAVNIRDGTLRLLDDEKARENAVNEAWKCLRQLLVGLARLRARAGLGSGALLDARDGQDTATLSA